MAWREQVSQENYDIITARYQKFLDTVHDINQEPIKVFNPLSDKQMAEIQLIRDVSQELQFKKEEDMRKAAQAREEANKPAVEEEKEAEEVSEQESKKEE